MGRSINQVNLMGRLTRDPEQRQTSNGTNITSFSIAVDRQGDNDTTDFFDVTCWNNLAEIVSKYTKKGSKVYVSGRLQLDRWESDGQKKSKVSVIANEVVFLDPATQSGDTAVQKQQKEVGTLDDDINLDDIPF